MKNYIPQRIVSLSENDIFYVYEKRINKCSKEGCDGTVKYGIIKKVQLDGEEINCFTCNKCHMLYTPYANYHRIKNKKLLMIYNADQVAEWREHTQHKKEVANKLKRRAQKPYDRFQSRNRYEDKSGFYNQRNTGRDSQRYGYKSKFDGDRKPYTYKNNSYHSSNNSYGNNSYSNNSYNSNSYSNNSYNNNGYSNNSYNSNSYSNNSYNNNGYSNNSYNNNGYSNNSYSNNGYNNNNNANKGYHNSSYHNGYNNYNNKYSNRKNAFYDNKNVAKTFTVRKGNIVRTPKQTEEE